MRLDFRTYMPFFLVCLGLFGRFIPHLPNMTPITAICLVAGVYMSRPSLAFGIPLLTLVASDWIFGVMYPGIVWVYLGFIGIMVIGRMAKQSMLSGKWVFVTLAGSSCFFVVSNFGVWVSSGLYPHTFGGLLEAYVLALPFFRNAVLGDILYVPVLLMVCRYWPSFSKQDVPVL